MTPCPYVNVHIIHIITSCALVVYRLGKPALLVVNKADAMPSELPEEDTRKLGLGKPIYISVSHNQVCLHSVHIHSLVSLSCALQEMHVQMTHIVKATN
jgi:hypothetical protein